MSNSKLQRMKISDFKSERKSEVDKIYEQKRNVIQKKLEALIAKRTGLKADERKELCGDKCLMYNAASDSEDETDSRDPTDELTEEFQKLQRTRYLLLSAPLDKVSGSRKRKLSIEKDERLRELQYDAFMQILDDIDIALKVVVKKKSQMYERIEKFVTDGAACEYVVIFNGHGSENGLMLEEEDPRAVPLDSVIAEIRNLVKKTDGAKNVKLIFAQCYGHLYSQDEVADEKIHVVSFTNERFRKTSTSMKLDTETGNIVEAKHLELERFAKDRKKENEHQTEAVPPSNLQQVTATSKYNDHGEQDSSTEELSIPQQEIQGAPNEDDCAVYQHENEQICKDVNHSLFDDHRPLFYLSSDDIDEGFNQERCIPFSTQVSVEQGSDRDDDSAFACDNRHSYFNDNSRVISEKFADSVQISDDAESLLLCEDSTETNAGYDIIEDCVNLRGTTGDFDHSPIEECESDKDGTNNGSKGMVALTLSSSFQTVMSEVMIHILDLWD